MRNILRYLAVAALVAVSGCAATPEAGPDRDTEAKQFEGDARSAVIYIYRDEMPNSAPASALTVDGHIVGDSLSATYFRVIVWPGENQIRAMASDAGRIDLLTRGGGVYFVEMKVSGGRDSSPSSFFRPVEPEIGKIAILRCCHLLETWRAGQWRLPW